MSLHARTLVGSGVRRVASPVGVGLFAAFVLLLAAFAAAVNTLLTAVAGTPLPLGAVVPEYGVVLPAHPAVAALAVLVVPFVVAFVGVVGSRLLLGDTVSRWADPVECLTERVVPATALTLVGSLAIVPAVALGTSLLLVPGLVLAGHFLLVPTVLATERVSLGGAFRASWQRTRGDRLELVTATAALVVPAAVVFGAATVSYVLPPAVEFALGIVVAAALCALWLGVATEAYRATGTAATRDRPTSSSRRASRAL
jgi:hypothetical protein